MCRLWAAEDHNPCMLGSTGAAVYGFIVVPLLSSSVEVGGQQFRKFTVFVCLWMGNDLRVGVRLYPDQLVRGQPLNKKI